MLNNARAHAVCPADRGNPTAVAVWRVHCPPRVTLRPSAARTQVGKTKADAITVHAGDGDEGKVTWVSPNAHGLNNSLPVTATSWGTTPGDATEGSKNDGGGALWEKLRQLCNEGASVVEIDDAASSVDRKW